MAKLFVFVGFKGGILRLIHSAQHYGGNVFDASKVNRKIVGFMGDRVRSHEPVAIMLDDALFEWPLVKDAVTSEMTSKHFTRNLEIV